MAGKKSLIHLRKNKMKYNWLNLLNFLSIIAVKCVANKCLVLIDGLNFINENFLLDAVWIAYSVIDIIKSIISSFQTPRSVKMLKSV